MIRNLCTCTPDVHTITCIFICESRDNLLEDKYNVEVILKDSVLKGTGEFYGYDISSVLLSSLFPYFTEQTKKVLMQIYDEHTKKWKSVNKFIQIYFIHALVKCSKCLGYSFQNNKTIKFKIRIIRDEHIHLLFD